MLAYTKSSLLAATLLVSSAVAAPATRGLLDWVLPQSLTSLDIWGAPANDFNCKSSHNPVVMIHGLSLSRDIFLNQLQTYLNERGYCTYSLTYGAHSLAPWIGGLRPMRETAKEIGAFIREVKQKTGANKVDLVGHSEGGVHAVYVPMMVDGIKDIVEHTISLGPALWGAQYFGVTSLWYLGGDLTRNIVGTVIKTLGAPAADDMATDGAIYNDFQDNKGRVVQPGVKSTIIMSTSDALVEPQYSRIDEAAARNIFIQDICPDDKSGHGGIAVDRNIYQIIVNELEEQYGRKVECNYDNILLI